MIFYCFGSGGGGVFRVWRARSGGSRDLPNSSFRVCSCCALRFWLMLAPRSLSSFFHQYVFLRLLALRPCALLPPVCVALLCAGACVCVCARSLSLSFCWGPQQWVALRDASCFPVWCLVPGPPLASSLCLLACLSQSCLRCWRGGPRTSPLSLLLGFCLSRAVCTGLR